MKGSLLEISGSSLLYEFALPGSFFTVMQKIIVSSFCVLLCVYLVSAQSSSVTVPEELASAYFGALDMLGGLVCAASSRDWDYEFLRIALSAMALSKGSALIAEVLQELDVLSAEEFLRTRR